MDKKIDKNFFKQIIVIFLVILAANYAIRICLGSFSQKAYQKYYHSDEREIEIYNQEPIKNYIFNKYPTKINTKIYPQTIDKNKINKEASKRYEKIQNILIKKVKNSKNFKPILRKKICITNFGDDRLYYNENGSLEFIEKGDKECKYRYNTDGKINEVELIIKEKSNNTSINIIFNNNKEIKYYIKNYIEDELTESHIQIVPSFTKHINYNKYILKNNINIITSSICIWLIFTIFYFKHKKKIIILKSIDKDFFIQNNNWIIKTKAHIWSHIISVCGWGYVGYIIYSIIQNLNTFFFIIGAMILIYNFSLISLLCYLIEKLCFKNFKIKWNFIYTNKIYNIFWNIGFWINTIFSGIWLYIFLYKIIKQELILLTKDC